jgi:ABC-type branched-subunit amino acid transport system substrate-binding protein
MAGSLAAVSLAFALLALLGLPLPASAAGLTPREEAGRKIYREGVSPSGAPLQALVGPHSTPLEGKSVPCGSCHGNDGLGRPEGGVNPPAITWRELTKRYGHRHENGRQHGPFDQKTFAEALTFGTDPAGNKLDPSMPRYVMSHKDIADLIAYLKKIETDYDPGISADRLRIGTLLPARGRLAELGRVVAGVMQAYVDDINARGGIFGRRIELVRAEFSDDPGAAVAAAERLLRKENVFALVGPFSVGIENELSRLAEETRVPVVGPFTLLPEGTLAVNRYTFYIMPGLREQAMALARFAISGLGLQDPGVGIIYPAAPGYEDVVVAVEEVLKEQKWEKLARAPYEAGRPPEARLVAELQQKGVQVLLFLGSDGDLAALGTLVRDAIWSPYLLAPGTKVARAAAALPVTFGERVFLAYPSLPQDITAGGAAALAELERKGKVGPRHQPAQVSAYASLQVLEEGLKRAGRDLSRVKLADSLENLYSFESGVTPTISFGPNRRVGVFGAHIVRVDLTNHSFRPLGRFVRLD